LTRSKTSNRPSRHPPEGVVVGPNIVGMAQPGATAAEERAVGAEAEEGGEAAHDQTAHGAIKCSIPLTDTPHHLYNDVVAEMRDRPYISASFRSP
jgi:hypothetical protein